jgi:hypothetical protein
MTSAPSTRRCTQSSWANRRGSWKACHSFLGTCVCACVRVCVCVCVLFRYWNACAYVSFLHVIYAHAYSRIYTHMHICDRIDTHIHIHTYSRTHTRMCTHTARTSRPRVFCRRWAVLCRTSTARVCVCVCVCAYACVCICMYVSVLPS